jgi:SAM-dependent methyltransferase
MRHTNYDEIAAAYDRRYTEEDYSGIERALLAFVGDKSPKVLEVGCGTGHWLRQLQNRQTNAIGIDLSRSMLLRAREKLRSGSVIHARAENLPFANRTFDRVFCINAHHHFADKLRFFEGARRVLRRGGSVMTVALDPHNGTDRWWVYEYFDGTREIDKERYPSCTQIREWMKTAGFTDTFTSEIQHLPGDARAAEALLNGMVTPGHTSQLAVLTRDEFSAGVERIRAAIHNDSELRLTADLRVYATYGRVAD